ncbi:hypothetical protein KUV57_12350 [Epibacterium sp. DP7N7-1]|nr:hypothetical protein [Epibacterium sp. DP7N7-1]
MPMSPEMAEQVIGDTEDPIFIGAVIARLAKKTPGIFYRSQDLLDHIGDEVLSSAFSFSALVLMKEDAATSRSMHWQSVDADAERLDVYAKMTNFKTEQPRNHQGAISALEALAPELLRKILGRLVDRAGGTIVLQPDSFPRLEERGIGVMMGACQDQLSPAKSFRFRALTFMSGVPEHACDLRMLCAREGGPIPREGESLEDFLDSPRAAIAPTITSSVNRELSG